MDLPGRDAHFDRDRAGFPAARSLRDLHALHRCLSHPCHRTRRLRNRRPALHSVLHHRTARRGAGGIARADRPARLRLRYLPGRLPLEFARAGGRRARVPASPFAPPLDELATMTEDDFRSKFRGSPVHAPSTRAFCATSPSRWAIVDWRNSVSRWNTWRRSRIRWLPSMRAGRSDNSMRDTPPRRLIPP